jgi:hypothetical protein
MRDGGNKTAIGMNPYEPRGLELPKGCKDLIDALHLAHFAHLVPLERSKSAVFRGGLPDVEGYLAAMLRPPPAVRWVIVLWPDQSDFIFVLCAREALSVFVDVSRGDAGHEQRIRQIFQKAGCKLISQSFGDVGSLASLRYALPHIASEAAEIVCDLLLRGCVAPEQGKLVFRVYGLSAA